MAEYTANALQAVETNQNVIFTDAVIPSMGAIMHRDDSGLFTLRSVPCQYCARYKATFGANIAIPDGGDVEAISLALAINGEPISATSMIVTPAATGDFFNVASSIYIDVPQGCCSQLSVENTSAQTIDIQNANLIIEKARGI